MKKVTYQQVADALNISRVTVWKAVNDKPGIAPDTKRSILQKAVEMGYPISIMNNQESTNNSPIPLSHSKPRLLQRMPMQLLWYLAQRHPISG